MMFVFADKPTGAKARMVLDGSGEYPYPSRAETYASTPGAAETRIFLFYTKRLGYDLWKRNVSQAFTQSHSLPKDEVLYAILPRGYSDDPNLVYRVLRLLYGWSKAPAYWSATLGDWLTSDGWTAVDPQHPNIVKKMVRTNDGAREMPMFIEYHVDDLALAAHPDCSKAREDFDKRFFRRFDAKDEGRLTRFVGLDVHCVGDRVYLTQAPIIAQLLEDMQLQDANPTLVPMQAGTRLSVRDRPAVPDKKRTKNFQHIVGVLQYLTTWTRQDIGFATHELSKHQSNPGDVHLDATVPVARYLKGTINYGPVSAPPVPEMKGKLIGAADSNWATDTDTRKLESAHVFFIEGFPGDWACQTQNCVATSTTEAEYIAASTAAKKAIVLKRLLQGLGMPLKGPVPIYEDNKGCQLLSESPGGSSRTRHIDVAVHNVRQLVHDDVVQLIPCPTADMPADILTKALPAPLFRKHRDAILGYTPLTAPPLPSFFKPWPKYSKG